MSDHNLTRVAGAAVDTEITTQLRGRLIAIVPEQTLTGDLTVYHGLGDAVAAYGDISTQDGGTGTDTVTIGGITISVVDPGPPADENEIAVELTAALLTDSLIAAILAHSDYAMEAWTAEQISATTIRITAKETGTDGNDIFLNSGGTTWLTPGGTLEFGAPGGSVFTIAATGLTQVGKYFGDRGICFTDGLAVVREAAGDEVGIVWAPGHSSD